MKYGYFAYSKADGTFLGELDATSENSYEATCKYREWICDLAVDCTVYVRYKDTWYMHADDSPFMSPVYVENLPKDLQMKLLVGAL